MATPLTPIECSAQPLCLSFHPVKDIVAAGLVDGTVELHDLVAKGSPVAAASRRTSEDAMESENDDDDPPDTILSSIRVAKEASYPQCGIHVPAATTSTAASTKPAAGAAEVQGTSFKSSKAKQGPSCRSVLFSRSPHDHKPEHDANGAKNDHDQRGADVRAGGEHLFTACNGGSLRCIDSELACNLQHGQDPDAASPILWSIENAHNAGINKLYQMPHSSPCGPALVSGDDAGTVRLWDTRMCGGGHGRDKSAPFDNLMQLPAGCIQHWKVNHDYVTDFETNDAGTTLFASSGDGTLSVFDIRFANRKGTPRSVNAPDVDPRKLTAQQQRSRANTWETSGYTQSDNQEDELLSLTLLKKSHKLLCGTQEGVLLLFSYGAWGDISDRFPGHPQSLDALLKIDEDTVLTGSSDGLVRAVQLLPNALLGVLGGHDGFPVEALGFSAGRRMVGSLSHDERIRLWDGAFLNEDSDEEEDAMQEGVPGAKPGAKGPSQAQAGHESDDEWDDVEVDEDEDMESDDSDSENGGGGGGGKPKKRENIFKTENETFFSDL